MDKGDDNFDSKHKKKKSVNFQGEIELGHKEVRRKRTSARAKSPSPTK